MARDAIHTRRGGAGPRARAGSGRRGPGRDSRLAAARRDGAAPPWKLPGRLADVAFLKRALFPVATPAGRFDGARSGGNAIGRPATAWSRVVCLDLDGVDDAPARRQRAGKPPCQAARRTPANLPRTSRTRAADPVQWTRAGPPLVARRGRRHPRGVRGEPRDRPDRRGQRHPESPLARPPAPGGRGPLRPDPRRGQEACAEARRAELPAELVAGSGGGEGVLLDGGSRAGQLTCAHCGAGDGLALNWRGGLRFRVSRGADALCCPGPDDPWLPALRRREPGGLRLRNDPPPPPRVC